MGHPVDTYEDKNSLEKFHQSLNDEELRDEIKPSSCCIQKFYGKRWYNIGFLMSLVWHRQKFEAFVTRSVWATTRPNLTKFDCKLFSQTEFA